MQLIPPQNIPLTVSPHFKNDTLRLIRKIREIKSRLNSAPDLDTTFIFPYSTDKLKKRNEIWSNLQKGLLLEDKKILIPWETPFNQLNKYREKRRDSGDRTEWYLGKHLILDGYESHLETMMWMYLPWINPMTEISEKIGTDSKGNRNFLDLRERITELLGEPTKIELEKFGSLDLGLVEWTNDRVKISIVGIEIFNCRYSLNIGLTKNRNEDYLNESIEKLKSQGLTEEELGK